MFRSKVFLAAALAGLWFASGCGGPEVKVGKETIASDDPCSWVDNPGAIRDKLAVVGTTQFMGNLGQARHDAAVAGRAEMAATLKAEITQLVENWAKTAGDLNRAKETLTALVNNETFTRQFVDDVIRGARPMAYCPPSSQELDPGQPIYCLVVLEDPLQWQNNIDQQFENELLRDETLWKTEAMKATMRERMEKLKQENQDKRQEQINAVRSLAPGGGQ